MLSNSLNDKTWVAEIDVLVKQLKKMLKGKALDACDTDTKDTDIEGED